MLDARQRLRVARRELEGLLVERTVDFGIELRVVRQDPNGEVIYPGTPKVVEVARHTFGGMVDPKRRIIVGPSRNPVIWHCSERQAEILLHDGRPPKQLTFGAAGAGKTRVLAQWILLRAVRLCERGLCEYQPRAAGVTAPTERRLGIVVEALAEVCPRSWYVHRKKASEWRLVCGVNLQLIATKEASTAIGSPIQGQSWAFHAGDEFQDSTQSHHHVLARGRSAPDGVYEQLITATAKDSAAWRDFRDSLPEEFWTTSRLDGPSNAFVPASWWIDLKTQLSERRYKQLVLAEDVGPERAMFPAWQRQIHMRPLPRLGAMDVTASVVGYQNHSILVGHDPGTLRTVSVLLKAFRLPREKEHSWWIIGELATAMSTTEEHAHELVQLLQQEHNCQWPSRDNDEDRALVRVDPWTTSDAGTHKSVHDQLRNAGLKAMSASYISTRGGAVKQGHVHVGASVEMINRLLRSAAGTTRLYVALNDDGEPMAPQTARALELAEWKSDGYRENVRKDDKQTDWSDYHSALRYALWALERTRLEMRPATRDMVFA